MRASPNYSNGSFVNRSLTPRLTKGYSMTKVMFEFFFRQPKGMKPPTTIPSVRTDLNNLPQGDWLVWFGHSSYFLRTDDVSFLVDPVFSGNASPIPGSTKSFKGANVYSADDMPQVDYLVITHDHYDHLDYDTVKRVKTKVTKVICGLGVGAHLERWGYRDEDIIELDWNEEAQLKNGLKIVALPARHFSGRTFAFNATLWMSCLLQTPTRKIYLGGDSGYDTHFKEIGDKYGPIDLAILENGQYNEAWKAIHFLPGENLQAAIDLQARRVMPVHSMKFAIALHAWDEPMIEMFKRNERVGLPLVTPMIGEPVNLNDESHQFTQWWQRLK